MTTPVATRRQLRPCSQHTGARSGRCRQGQGDTAAKRRCKGKTDYKGSGGEQGGKSDDGKGQGHGNDNNSGQGVTATMAEYRLIQS